MNTVLGTSSFLLFLFAFSFLSVTHGFSNQRASVVGGRQDPFLPSSSLTTSTTTPSSSSKSRYAYEPVLGGVSSYLVSGEELPRRHLFWNARALPSSSVPFQTTNPNSVLLAIDGSVAAANIRAADWVWTTPPLQAPRRSPSWPTLRRPTVSVKKVVSQAMAWYMKALQEKPFLTKCWSAGIVQAVGDLLSQRLFALWQGQPLVVDGARTLSFVMAGCLFNAPFLHYWYQTISRLGHGWQRTFQWSDHGRVGAELAVDQSVGVFMYYPLYFVAYELCAAASYGRAPQLAALATTGGLQTVATAIRAQYFLWPLAQLVSFKAVPEKLRVLFTCLVSIFWNIFFCGMVAKG